MGLTNGVKRHSHVGAAVMTEQNFGGYIIGLVPGLTKAVILRSTHFAIRQLNRSILKLNRHSLMGHYRFNFDSHLNLFIFIRKSAKSKCLYSSRKKHKKSSERA